MRILLLNQAFHPDTVSTAQHLSDLGKALVSRGHQVVVVASRRGYDNPSLKFAPRETWNGIRIYRVYTTGFGKGARWRRALDFASFMFSCMLRLVFLRRVDLVVALTSPPLISVVGAIFARFWRAKFVYWVMDLNPDEAIAAGWLNPRSLVGRFLMRLSQYCFEKADLVIALDRFMRDRILEKCGSPGKVVVLPPWAHDEDVRFDEGARREFRRMHGLETRFVVMYAGNHSPIHPLDTVLDAAYELRYDQEIVFCFVGGGSVWHRIKPLSGISEQVRGCQSARVVEVKLEEKTVSGDRRRWRWQQLNSPPGNILCLPYQPRMKLAGVLSAADVHVVVMGEKFVGIVHPCKIYNILRVGAPILYVGPKESHIAEILDELPSWYPARMIDHGDVSGLIDAIYELRRVAASWTREVPEALLEKTSQRSLVPKFVEVLESWGQSDHA